MLIILKRLQLQMQPIEEELAGLLEALRLVASCLAAALACNSRPEHLSKLRESLSELNQHRWGAPSCFNIGVKLACILLMLQHDILRRLHMWMLLEHVTVNV